MEENEEEEEEEVCGGCILVGEKRIMCIYSVGRLGLKVGVKGRNSPLNSPKKRLSGLNRRFGSAARLPFEVAV